jgi:hypothetical protein
MSTFRDLMNPNKRGFVAGVAIGALVAAGAIVNTAVDVAKIASHHIEWFKKGERYLRDTDGRQVAAARSPVPMYATTFDGHRPQTWKLTIHGQDEFSGEAEDVQTGAKGLVHGWWRDGKAILSYASKDPQRPGFGTYVFEPYHSAFEGESPMYVGVALGNDCGCGETVKTGSIVDIESAVMTARPKPPDSLTKAVFKKPVVPDFVSVSSLQQTARK